MANWKNVPGGEGCGAGAAAGGRFRRAPGGRRPRERRAADPRARRPLAFLRALSRAARRRRRQPRGPPARSPPADSEPATTNRFTVCTAIIIYFIILHRSLDVHFLLILYRSHILSEFKFNSKSIAMMF